MVRFDLKIRPSAEHLDEGAGALPSPAFKAPVVRGRPIEICGAAARSKSAHARVEKPGSKLRK